MVVEVANSASGSRSSSIIAAKSFVAAAVAQQNAVLYLLAFFADIF